MQRTNQFFYLLFFTILSTLTFAQSKIKSPDEFLPYKLGEHFTPHHLLVNYYQYVAANNPQVIIREYGRTNELRPLIWAVISSPENLKNLKQIRTDNLKRAGLMEGKPIGKKPIAIIWLSYGVHGNEAAASESSISTLYELANPDNKKMQSLLDDAIVILDPCINPDGYSRFTHWYWNAANKTINPNPESREQNEIWPRGRINHYLFDLNRDWAWHTQVETQQRLDIYNQWMPHIHVDFHEMGHNSPYYFAPAAQPYHEYITDWQGNFQQEIGKNHAKYFDKNGWLYFTREVFDLFYPSYGDTYPIFNGAIGMTYEQGGGSGRAISMENNDTLTLKDRVEHHTITSISTIEVGSVNASLLVQNFEDYFKKSANNPQGDYKTFVIPANNSTDKIKSLCAFLDKHHIKYGKSGKSQTLNAYHYENGNEIPYTINDQDLIISAYQAKATLTQVLFEPNPFLVDSLTYDITAWSLPHAFGLDAYASRQKVSADKTYHVPAFKSKSTASSVAYAYLLEWQSINDAQFLGALLKEDIKVRFATETLDLNGNKYKPGTLIITRGDNRKINGFEKTVINLANQFERNLIFIKSGFSNNGIDLGSRKNHILTSPKIALLQSDRVSSSAFGQAWHFFENDLDYGITVLPVRNFQRSNLSQYNLIIMTEGRYDLNSTTLDKLKSWISAGGRLIIIGSALSTLEGKDRFTIEKFATSKEKDAAKKESEKQSLDRRLLHYGDRTRSRIINQMPGAIFKLKLDNTHPLAFGMPDYYFSLKTSSRAYSFLKNTWNVGYIEENPLILGFAGAKAIKKMKNTTVFGVQSMGRGSVIYMVDNPLFRGFWRQGKFLFSNAVFFAGQ